MTQHATLHSTAQHSTNNCTSVCGWLLPAYFVTRASATAPSTARHQEKVTRERQVATLRRLCAEDRPGPQEPLELKK